METMTKDQEFNAGEFFGKIFLGIGSIFLPLLLAIIIAGVSFQLISDAGEFFGSFWKAFFLEMGAIALIAWRPNDWKKLLRAAALIVAFGIVIVAAGMNAATPHLADSGFSEADKIRLASLNASIESHEKALASVAGQPRNSAMRSQSLAEAIAERDDFVSSMTPDATVVSANWMAAMTAIMFRISLQLINWLLAYQLAAGPLVHFDCRQKNQWRILWTDAGL